MITFNSLETRVLNHYLASRALPPLEHEVKEGGEAGRGRGEEGEGELWRMLPGGGHAMLVRPTAAEVDANPRARSAALWCLTRGGRPASTVGGEGMEGCLSEEQWQEDMEGLRLEDLVAAPPAPVYARRAEGMR